MKLEELSKDKKAAIGARWLNYIYSMYEAETSRFLKREKDPHANPVGHALREGTVRILDEIAGATMPMAGFNPAMAPRYPAPNNTATAAREIRICIAQHLVIC